jgi:hypothetical protein
VFSDQERAYALEVSLDQERAYALEVSEVFRLLILSRDKDSVSRNSLLKCRSAV